MSAHPNLSQLITEYAAKLEECLEQLLPRHPNEAEFRQPIDQLLEEFCAEAELNPLAHAEYTLATGRADAVFNRLVIEYERPGTLSDKLSHRATAHALDQVKRYLTGLARRQRHELTRMAGIVFDGHYIIFVHYRMGDFAIEGPVSVNRELLERLLRWLAGTASGIALTAENLNRDFSIEQLRTQNILRALMQGLMNALVKSPDQMVTNLFEQWRTFFSQSIDYSEAFGGRKLEPLKRWVRKAGLTINTPEEAEHFFFALHTYFALLVKLIAWRALSRHLAVKLGVPSFGELISADSDTLHRRLRELEEGGIFRAFGLTNLLEGDFFAWYLYAWDKPIEDAIRELLKRLDEYDPATLSILPEESRDLFKKLYHYLLPREIRHNLGEYYTPDWLAQRLLNQVDYEFFNEAPRRNERRLREKLLNTRWLDPACGSGTFPVLIIARMRQLGRALFINETELLNAILRNVVGFDLNPLAVLTARVNYLLAIADLLEHRRGEVTIPVYLADSVRTPVMETFFSGGTYKFPTAVDTFGVPAVLCTKERFDRFCNILEESVRAQISPDAFISRIERELKLAPPEWQQRDADLARKVYEKISDLHRQGMNGIWARLLKNNFAPLTVGQFDYIVGNPPWVNWEHLPDGYRDSTRDLWDRYQLAGTFRGGRPRLGAVKVDISALMTYTVMDTLLKPGGRLGFVITQSLFKTAGAGAGFRRFSIPRGDGRRTPLRILCVEDMVSLQPFEGASNRTAVMVLEKGKPTAYPVPYTVWRKQGRERFTYDSTLEEVTNATVRLKFVAEPVNPSDPTSPWLTARPKVIRAIRKVLGKSDYEAHAGVCTWLNSVYWVEIALKRPDGLVVVRNITEGARVRVNEVTEPIEPDLLYPLLRGRDVQRWRAEPSAWMIVPQDPGDPTRAYPEQQLQKDYPKTYGYLKRFERELRNRSGYQQILSRREREFYGVMDIGTYTFAPWKVVWTRLARIEAAVVGLHEGKPIVPQETVTLVECSSANEAHYICALVNSSPFQFAAISYSQEGGKSMGSMHILEHIRIPRFDRKNPVHLRLAELSKQAHEAAEIGDETRLREIEAEIDRQAAKLWGLSDDELRDIQQSLAELSETPEPTDEE
jgi:methylase of polypeptide subunit release factors